VVAVGEEAGEAEEGEHGENEYVEDEEDGGEDALAGEAVGEEVEDYGEDAGVHGDCEPLLELVFTMNLQNKFWIGITITAKSS
jgi:hypothetical protein